VLSKLGRRQKVVAIEILQCSEPQTLKFSTKWMIEKDRIRNDMIPPSLIPLVLSQVMLDGVGGTSSGYHEALSAESGSTSCHRNGDLPHRLFRFYHPDHLLQHNHTLTHSMIPNPRAQSEGNRHPLLWSFRFPVFLHELRSSYRGEEQPNVRNAWHLSSSATAKFQRQTFGGV
jgi:hypothetical protein